MNNLFPYLDIAKFGLKVSKGSFRCCRPTKNAHILPCVLRFFAALRFIRLGRACPEP